MWSSGVGSRSVRAVALLAVAAVVGGGCAAWNRPLPPLVSGDDAPARPCATAAVRSCGLPYPSDEFTVADPLSGTGRRVEMPDGLIAEKVTDRLGPGAGVADAFADADGFAALTPVIFEVGERVDPTSMPRDGGDVLAVFDLDTGERVPIRAEVPIDAARHGAPDTIVMAWPRGAFEHGHTYVARLTDGLRPYSGGGTLARARGLDEDGGWTGTLRDSLEQVEPGRWHDVVSATRFTVRSRDNATAQIDAMAAIARAEDHPFRKVQVDPPYLVQNASAVVSGEVRLSDFRDDDGVARVENGSRERWVRFVLTLPKKPAGVDGAPVVIYGHGLTINKESMLVVASDNASRGLATIGIDVPNHGSRQAGFDGGYLLDITSPRKFGRLASMPLQGIVDHVSLLGAVREHLGELELRIPPSLLGAGGPAPRLDTSRLLYTGTSMGGVLGAAFTGLAPELDGSFLQVAGTGTADIIFHSLLWPVFMGIIPDAATTGDAYALFGAATMLLDLSDNVNLVERAREHGTPVFLAYGVNDGIVPNFASDRLIHLLDLPLVGRQITRVEPPAASAGSDVPPVDGWGAAQIWSNMAVEVHSFGAHVVFAEPRSAKLLGQWTDGRLAALGVQPAG